MKKIVLMTLALMMAVCFVVPGNVLAQRYGGELNIAIGTDPEMIDPIRATSSPAAMVMVHIMETLFDYTVDGEIVPLLARDYDVSDDGLVWDLFLREGIEFHDGTPFNAEAVKYNLERMLDPANEAVYAFLIDEISEIEVLDEYTVRIKTGEPFAPIMAHLSHNFLSMVSPTAAEKYGDDFNENPVGTGPFTFESWTRGEKLSVVKNEDYWGDNAYLDRVNFLIVPEDATRVVMLETGEADAIMRVPPRDVERLGDRANTEVLSVPSVRTIYIGFNCQKEPFTDPRVRQAINYGVHNQAITDHILGGAGRPSDAPISPGLFGYSPQERYDFNPEKAKALLAEAGFEDGLKATLHHPVGRYLMDEVVAQAVQSQLTEIGVELELITMEWATYLEATGKRYDEAEQELYMLGWGCVTGDADYGLYSMFHSTQWRPDGPGRSYYKNERVDELLQRARVTADEDLRADLYAESIELIWEDAPWLFLHSESQLNGYNTRVQGLIHHPLEFISANEAWIEN